VRLRLHGTPAENAAVLDALAAALTMRTTSRSYPDQPPSTLERIYTEAEPRNTTGDNQ
jgi:hypothetical protein